MGRLIARFALCNFLLADVVGGLGPFLPVWLAARTAWPVGMVGAVVTLVSLAGLGCAVPAGLLIDRFGWPVRFLAAGSAAILAGALGLLMAWGGWQIGTGLLVMAMGGALVGPAMVAASLRCFGGPEFPRQLGRNAAWNNVGNVAAALLILGFSARAGGGAPRVVLRVLVALALAGLGALATLPRLGPASARMEAPGASGGPPVGSALAALLATPGLSALAALLLLFHLGNAAMLPLLGLRLAHFGHGGAVGWVSAAVLTAQACMVGTAWAAGRVAAGRGGAGLLLVVACAALILRGGLAAATSGAGWLVAVQMLDALGAGVLGVAVPVLAAGLDRSGRHTQAVLGVALTAQGIGAALSSWLGGLLIGALGWHFAFLALAAPAVPALLVALWMRSRGN